MRNDLDEPVADPLIRTVGHGTAGQTDFARLVREAAIQVIVDVRRYPGSRRHPHFGREAMEAWLPDAGVEYRWMETLGGRRSSSGASTNVGLRNAQFRAYADYMYSEEFVRAVKGLLALAASTCAAVMCSESVWWRCHRRLLSDHLVLVEGVRVEHLFHDGRLSPHPVTPGATRDGARVVYEVEAKPGAAPAG